MTLRLSGTSYVTLNLLFFEIVAIHSMLNNLEEVVETIDASNEESKKIEDIGSVSYTHLTLPTKRIV